MFIIFAKACQVACVPILTKDMKGLTIKQENFCNYYIESGNASDAYRRAYSSEKMRDKQIWEESCKLLSRPNVAQRVKELQEEQKKKSDITKEEIIKLCADVIRGKSITDYTEEYDGKKKVKTVSKTWAIERVCKMFGLDEPTKIDLKSMLFDVDTGDE